MSASCIVGQGYVDGKQQPVKELPVDDITNSFADIIQTELAKVNILTVTPAVPTPPASEPTPKIASHLCLQNLLHPL